MIWAVSDSSPDLCLIPFDDVAFRHRWVGFDGRIKNLQKRSGGTKPAIDAIFVPWMQLIVHKRDT